MSSEEKNTHQKLAVPKAEFKFCTVCSRPLLTRSGQRRATQLYDEDLLAKSGILRLLGCRECGASVADKYVECDGVLVLIDLMLHNLEAYRHVLLNGSYMTLILKMTLLTIICDGYMFWSDSPTPGEFFEEEYVFYGMCAKVVLGLLGYVTIGLIGLTLATGEVKTCLIGLLMGYSSRITHLASFLWAGNGDHASSDWMWIFTHLITFGTTLRIVQVSCGRSRASSLAVSLLAHLMFLIVANLDSLILEGQMYTCI